MRPQPAEHRRFQRIAPDVQAVVAGAFVSRRRAAKQILRDHCVADVLARIADLGTSRLHELLPWEWKLLRQTGNSGDQQAA